MLMSVSVLISDVSLLQKRRNSSNEKVSELVFECGLGFFFLENQPLSELPTFCYTEVTSGSSPSICGEQ